MDKISSDYIRGSRRFNPPRKANSYIALSLTRDWDYRKNGPLINRPVLANVPLVTPINWGNRAGVFSGVILTKGPSKVYSQLAFTAHDFLADTPPSPLFKTSRAIPRSVFFAAGNLKPFSIILRHQPIYFGSDIIAGYQCRPDRPLPDFPNQRTPDGGEADHPKYDF